MKVGLHGQMFPEDASLPPLLSAYPVEPGLVDLSGERAGGEPTEKLTLADTIAPHWFSPPEGVVYTTIYTFLHLYMYMYMCNIQFTCVNVHCKYIVHRDTYTCVYMYTCTCTL